MHKISTGKFRGRKLAPIGNAPIRPPLDKIKQAVFNMFAPFDDERVLDLFAGSGSFGLEALSRGAAHVTFIENHSLSLHVLNANIDLLDVAKQCSVIKESVFTCPAVLDEPYSILLVDPPYALYDDAKKIQQLADTLDELWLQKKLDPSFKAAIESPKRKAADFIFKHLNIRDIRKYGQTELILIAPPN